MVHSFLAFSCFSSALFGAFFSSSCCRDGLSWGGVRSGKSSGEEIGLRDGNENVLIMLGGDCLSRDCALLTCPIWCGRMFFNWGWNGGASI